MSINENNELIIMEEGIEVQQTKSYGVGIDTHSKFIQVSVLVKRDMKFYEYRHEFPTDWNSLVDARSWVLRIISSCSEPVPDLSNSPLHYCLESTSTYHLPVIMAWEGTPSIVNPTLAGSTKRKTDVLDAKLLALQDLTGVWPESYIPSTDVKELRVLISERNRFVHEATSIGNRINNIIVRFGLTIGREGSVVKNSDIRFIIENQISENPSSYSHLCPVPIPESTCSILRYEYEKYDIATNKASELKNLILNKVLSMSWETDTSTLSGEEMLKLLTSAPQVGEITAITWLAHIITPRRFPNSKALAAYCGLDPSLKVSAKHVTSTVKRGGCKELHHALTSSGDRLIRCHSEMFGRWGYNLYCQTGKWKKASNAVGRKLAVAMYYMMKSGSEFSYESYDLIKSIGVFDIPIDELPNLNPDFKRYIRILKEHEIYSTNEMVTSYLSCELGSLKGHGRKFFSIIRDYLNNQHKYQKLYDQLHKGGSYESEQQHQQEYSKE